MQNTGLVENGTISTIGTINFRNKQYKKVPNDWKDIKRFNDTSKSLARNARDILFTALYQINKYEQAILTHEELSKITETKNHQNCILVKQLKFVLNIEFFRSHTENGKKYRDGYIFTKNQNTDKILKKPAEYFANLLSKNSGISANKFSDDCEKIYSYKKTSANKFSDDCEKIRLPLHIYKKNKDKINDYLDYQDNQQKNISEIDLVETEEYNTENHVLNEQNNFTECSYLPEIADSVESHVNGLAKEESLAEAVHKTETIDFAETASSLEVNEVFAKQVAENVTCQDITSKTPNKATREAKTNYIGYPPLSNDFTPVEALIAGIAIEKTSEIGIRQNTRPAKRGLDGKTYTTIPLANFKYSQALLKDIISRCNRNRQHYTPANVIRIICNILEKAPDTQIWGGRQGFINYMIKAINGENDYSEKGEENAEERLTSIAEVRVQQSKELHERIAKGGVTWL